MKRHELIKTSPLRLLSPVEGGQVAGRHLALVKGPAGTGKTAVLVQIALDTLLRGEEVVHVGVNHTLEKIKLWYGEVFAALARQVNLANATGVENEIMGHRLLMTFMADNFTPLRLAQRLDALGRHHIALPACLVIDGLVAEPGIYEELRIFALEHNLTMWLSCPEGPSPADKAADTLLELQTSPEGVTSLVVVRDDAGYARPGAAMTLDAQALNLCR
ncbi:MAG: hypothetical protein RI601_06460 [Desulfurivibrionaceae bacterium]|nr:hypothetical protein [Desulfurivibrionaceae bacterium]